MLEKTIEKRVCDYAKSMGMGVYKFNSAARAAVPDRMIIAPTGKIIFIEFKQTGKKPTGPQTRELSRLMKMNVPAFVVDNIETGKYVVEMLNLGVDMKKLSDDLWIC